MGQKPGRKMKDRIVSLWRTHSRNVMLAVGLLLTIIGVILLVLSVSRSRLLFLRPTFILFIGSAVLYFSLTEIKRARYVFIGTVLTLLGVILLLFDAGILRAKLEQLWPFIVIICGIAFIPAGFYHFRKFHPVFLVPGIVLCIMGCFFLLFSLNIITESFSSVMAKWWPALFIICGLMLTGMFFKNNRQKPGQKNSIDKNDEGSDGGD